MVDPSFGPPDHGAVSSPFRPHVGNGKQGRGLKSARGKIAEIELLADPERLSQIDVALLAN